MYTSTQSPEERLSLRMIAAIWTGPAPLEAAEDGFAERAHAHVRPQWTHLRSEVDLDAHGIEMQVNPSLRA